jgi:hypothetical protein
MSTNLQTNRGHLTLFAGAVMGNGERLIGIQAETIGGSPGLGAALLTRDQALVLAAELADRADYDVRSPERKPISSGDGDSAFYRAQERLEASK